MWNKQSKTTVRLKFCNAHVVFYCRTVLMDIRQAGTVPYHYVVVKLEVVLLFLLACPGVAYAWWHGRLDEWYSLWCNVVLVCAHRLCCFWRCVFFSTPFDKRWMFTSNIFISEVAHFFFAELPSTHQSLQWHQSADSKFISQESWSISEKSHKEGHLYHARNKHSKLNVQPCRKKVLKKHGIESLKGQKHSR